MLRTGNKGLAAATLVLDALKGVAALLIAEAVWGEGPGLAAGFGAMLGHAFPVWLGFRGGKGVATGGGVLLAASWWMGLAAALVWLAVAGAHANLLGGARWRPARRRPWWRWSPAGPTSRSSPPGSRCWWWPATAPTSRACSPAPSRASAGERLMEPVQMLAPARRVPDRPQLQLRPAALRRSWLFLPGAEEAVLRAAPALGADAVDPGA